MSIRKLGTAIGLTAIMAVSATALALNLVPQSQAQGASAARGVTYIIPAPGSQTGFLVGCANGNVVYAVRDGFDINPNSYVNSNVFQAC